ncbi:MAG: ABC transporter permease [Ignavibacteria bacterium]|nr:MAG: ABC transporter permease [Ignavibacteria bacterium]
MTGLMETIKVALNSLRANKLRSSLTILGIVVGIFSIISISTVISMLQASIEEGVSALSKNVFQIQKWPAIRTGGPNEWARLRNRRDITLDEFEKLRDRLIDAEAVGAEIWDGGNIVKFNGEETNPNVSVGGITEEAFKNNEWGIAYGRSISNVDIARSEFVIVLGADIVKKLFPTISPIDQEIKVDSKIFRVIGVLEEKGDVFGQSQDNFALIPISTFQLIHGKNSRSVNITVKAKDKESYADLMEKAEGFMRTIRKVPPGEPNDFEFRTNQAMLDRINEITSGVRIGALVVAAIALLAAGVGIMNIMLVSVTERTKEIGIRKAIGARRNVILYQFITEAVVLSLLGGLIGIIIGIIVGNLAGMALKATAVVPLDWVLIGVLVCVAIGVTFGTYPAYKASNLDPIDALRYE